MSSSFIYVCNAWMHAVHSSQLANQPTNQPLPPPSLNARQFDLATDSTNSCSSKTTRSHQSQRMLLYTRNIEKCWANSPLRAAARPFTRCRFCRHCRTPPAHRCPRHRRRQRPRRQRQRQRVTEGTAIAR